MAEKLAREVEAAKDAAMSKATGTDLSNAQASPQGSGENLPGHIRKRGPDGYPDGGATGKTRPVK